MLVHLVCAIVLLSCFFKLSFHKQPKKLRALVANGWRGKRSPV